MDKNIGKNISKSLSGKYSQKESTTDTLKTTSNIVTQKTADATGDLTGNKSVEKLKITIVSKNSHQINSETVSNEHDKEIFKERYISSEERPRVIHDLRLI